MAALDVKVLDMKDGEVTKISYEGAEYERVDGEEKKGDIALVLEAWGSQEVGEYYRVNREENETYRKGDSKLFVHIEGKYTDAECYWERVQLFRKIEEPLKVGDYARVEQCTKYKPIPDGTLVVIKNIDIEGYVATPVNPVGIAKDYWLYKDELVRATDEEVAEAERKLDPRSKFEKGDKVRIISGGGEFPLLGFHDGEICEVIDPYCMQHNGDRIQITRNSVGIGYALPKQLEKVSGEAVKWAEIGREPGEYKEGDIVRVIDASKSSAALVNGEIGEITGYNHSGFFKVSHKALCWVDSSQVELVTPVERRFDR
ncbi:hypothetical protein P4631_09175 [Halalkalibacterium halodurans]|uniref:hypothetical protein n=1 Tax=Halalkalibacterium halodurans TaxID=86665 RepID=UPI002E1A2D83|nr:hypothetical protein [Halalkalibacterium halodurans]